MIGIIWESVLRVPILLLLSDGFFGGPARGPEKKVFKKCSFFDSIFRGKNDTVFEVKKVVKKWVKNDPKNDPQNDPQNDPRKGLAGPLVNCLALSFCCNRNRYDRYNGASYRYDCFKRRDERPFRMLFCYAPETPCGRSQRLNLFRLGLRLFDL